MPTLEQPTAESQAFSAQVQALQAQQQILFDQNQRALERQELRDKLFTGAVFGVPKKLVWAVLIAALGAFIYKRYAKGGGGDAAKRPARRRPRKGKK